VAIVWVVLTSLTCSRVIYAYGEAQWYLTIAATVVLVPCFIFIGIWKDFKVKELRQVKGRVA
jgi:hypothetical protein